ncbi:MAG: aldose 1-epimerase family protein [Ferruginibacter sp.]
MYTIENDNLIVKINAAGAELNSIVNKPNNMEYLWSGDAKIWGKKSPVLFPIIGTLKNNIYFYNHKSYHLNRHGFAREMNFSVTNQDTTSITFTLENDEHTFTVFPFHFLFSINYSLRENALYVTYSVTNSGAEKMYFSVGGHPAFKMPIAEELNYADYYLQFNKVENTGRWPISKDGLIELEPTPLLNNTNKLDLTKELFYQDAIVFKDLHSNEVTLKSDKDTAGLSFSFKEFPFLGIWAAKDADFVCIEPWCGIADSVNTNQDITQKEGIIELKAGNDFKRTWSVAIF